MENLSQLWGLSPLAPNVSHTQLLFISSVHCNVFRSDGPILGDNEQCPLHVTLLYERRLPLHVLFG